MNNNTEKNKLKTTTIALLAVVPIIAGGALFFTKHKGDMSSVYLENIADIEGYLIDTTKETAEIVDYLFKNDNDSISTYQLSNEYVVCLAEKEDKTTVFEFDKNLKIYKNFEIKNNKEDSIIEHPTLLGDEYIVFAKNYVNDNVCTELVIYDNKGNLVKSTSFNAGEYIEKINYSKDSEMLIVSFYDSSYKEYVALYDKELNKINQFEKKFKRDDIEYEIYTTIKDGNLITFSTGYINNSENKTEKTIFAINEYDLSGNLISQKERLLSPDISIPVIKEFDAGFLVVISEIVEKESEFISLSKTSFAKIDKNGKVLWEIKNDNKYSLYEEYILEVEDGIIALALPTTAQEEDMSAIVKYDFKGKIIWEKNLKLSSNNKSDFELVSLLKDEDDVKIQGFYSNNENIETFEFKIDKNGNLMK